MEDNRIKIDTETQELIKANERLGTAINTIAGLVAIAVEIEDLPEYTRLHLLSYAGEGIRNLVREHLNTHFYRESIVGGVDQMVGRGIRLDLLACELHDVPRRKGRNPLPASAWTENWRGVRDAVTTLKIY